MPTVLLKNTNPIGEVDVPLIRRHGLPEHKRDAAGKPLEGKDRWGFGCLEPGEEFEVTDVQAKALLEQAGNYELADPKAEKARQAALAKAAKAEDGETE